MTTVKWKCGLCGVDLEEGRVGNCGKHPVNDAYDTFWKLWRVDLNKIPELDKLQEALIESFRVAAGISGPNK